MEVTDSKDKALAIGHFALEKKADNLEILDMQKVATFCDYFVILSAGSVKKTKAIAEYIKEALNEKGVAPHHIEGLDEGRWILIDFGEVIVHIFYEETRSFYGLERLWGDAQRLDISS